MLRRAPISVRLALWYGFTLFLLLSAFAGYCYTGFHLTLHRDYDRHLTHEERELRPFVTATPAGPAFAGLETLTSVAYQTDGVYGTYVRLLAPDGAVRYQSPNFATYEPLPVALPDEPAPTTLSRTWSGLPARSRYVPVRATEAGPPVGWLEVTGFEWSVHQELHELAYTLLAGVLVSVLFALGGGWWMARRTLRPVASMTTAAAEMGSRDFTARLPTDFGTHDELTELAHTFNDLLVRLEESVVRERRFTDNAAHELLTPLATLRSEAEVTLRRDRTPADYRATLHRLLADVERMTATVQGLLQLARADTIRKRPGERLDASALLADHVARHRPQAEARGLRLDADVAPGVFLSAGATPLAEVVDNLLGNAVKYTAPGGRVLVRLRHLDGTATLTVEDTGAGFEPGEASRLFDRFYRSDAPAVQREPGSGLGLAIVKAIVEAYGGTVEAHSTGPGRGAAFTARLPCLACAP